VVWISVAGLMFSGTLSLYRMWETYQQEKFDFVSRWALAHMILGAGAMVVALLLTLGRQPPANPVRWMRLNVVILLVAIFLGSSTHHFQLRLGEAGGHRGKLPPTTQPDREPATRHGPVTIPSTQP
jgi:peptidoglycan/LPS O-acetylase OafA/YrhL